MSSHAKLSTSSRVLTALTLLLTVSFALAILPSTSDAKRPKKESTSPKTGPAVEDSSALYDTTVPPLDEFVSVEVEPEMFHIEPPVYPMELKNQSVIEMVWVRAGVDMKGVVRDAKVARSSGNQALDDAALAAARKCSFKPAIQNGKPVAAWVNCLMNFEGKQYSGGKESTFSTQLKGELDTTLPGPNDHIPTDSMPDMIYNAQPYYPRLARTAGLMGTVWIRALVDKTGKVRAVAVLKSSGSMSLDASAMDAGWENRFIPAKKDGQPVAVWITYKVDFTLTEGR
ncbi:MAG: TonB family protein [bacterium]|nr:TonB family protein [bacterium]